MALRGQIPMSWPSRGFSCRIRQCFLLLMVRKLRLMQSFRQ